jgi:hypothetical protein
LRFKSPRAGTHPLKFGFMHLKVFWSLKVNLIKFLVQNPDSKDRQLFKAPKESTAFHIRRIVTINQKLVILHDLNATRTTGNCKHTKIGCKISIPQKENSKQFNLYHTLKTARY